MNLSPAPHHDWARLGIESRRLVIRSVYEAGAGHIGGPLSAVDMLVALYFDVLNVDPAHPDWPDRDRFIMSKGHSAIGLYAVLALRGFIPIEELKTFDAAGSRLQGHPDMSSLPVLDMSTGSLGQGLSPGVGMALGARLLGRSFHTWVMVGDGESQEGQIWEAAMVAARYRLTNLTVIVDLNRQQQYGWPGAQGYGSAARQAPLENPRGIWEAFGWNVIETDGHDAARFIGACAEARQRADKPSVILAATVKGKGVSFMEDDFRWHARVPTADEFAKAMAELDEQERGLRSDP